MEVQLQMQGVPQTPQDSRQEQQDGHQTQEEAGPHSGVAGQMQPSGVSAGPLQFRAQEVGTAVEAFQVGQGAGSEAPEAKR